MNSAEESNIQSRVTISKFETNCVILKTKLLLKRRMETAVDVLVRYKH